MLFLQPVVVDDALAADRSAPAEVRIAERASYAADDVDGNHAGASIDRRQEPIRAERAGRQRHEPQEDAGEPGGRRPGTGNRARRRRRPAPAIRPARPSVEHHQDTADEDARLGTAARYHDDQPGHDHRHGGARHDRAGHHAEHDHARHRAEHGHARHHTEQDHTGHDAGARIRRGRGAGGMPSPKTTPTVPPANPADPSLGPVDSAGRKLGR